MAYGRIIPGLTIDGRPAPYGVANERAVRAAAGLMLATGALSFFYARSTGDVTPLYAVIPLFWIEFLLKTIFGPTVGPFAMAGAWVVRRQRPEWIGAVQKRFAWSLGLAMSSAMLVLWMALGVRGWPTLAICGICLTLMWLESAFGICVGCKIYGYLLRMNIIPTPEHAPACPGGACAMPPR